MVLWMSNGLLYDLWFICCSLNVKLFGIWPMVYMLFFECQTVCYMTYGLFVVLWMSNCLFPDDEGTKPTFCAQCKILWAQAHTKSCCNYLCQLVKQYFLFIQSVMTKCFCHRVLQNGFNSLIPLVMVFQPRILQSYIVNKL